MDYGYGHDLLDMTFKAQTNKKIINYKIFLDFYAPTDTISVGTGIPQNEGDL